MEKASVESSPALLEHRFEHYELVKGEDGKPIELGRGAMGVTYKAFDVDLHCPVTLKVISERYLGDESARLRFLREARAAASIRHPNVASVFHLGRSGQDYFYAMEFVEGETLENLIKRSGRLEVKLALEIVTQVAAGLAAVHKQKPRPPRHQTKQHHGESRGGKHCNSENHRPWAGEACTMTGLLQAAISTPGAFAGTPEFASPEQFAGVQRRHPFGSLFARCDALGDGDRPGTVPRFSRGGNVSASARILTARPTEKSLAASRCST